MKFNFKQLPQLFKKLVGTKSGSVAKGIANSADDIALGALNVVDDIPPVRHLPPHSIGLADDVLSDTTAYLGKHYAEPVLGMKSFHEITPDPSATIRVPEVPLDSLVFAQHDTNPSVISVRPHKNTALGHWFQNQTQNLHKPDDLLSWNGTLTSDKFVEMYNRNRLDEIARNRRLNEKALNDGDLPF